MTTSKERAEIDRFKRDMDYYETHREELLEQHPEQWVAIFNQEVVGAGADFDRVLDDLKQRDIPTAHTYIQYVTCKDEILILSL